MPKPAYEARPLREDERDWLSEVLLERWGGELIVGRGGVRQLSELQALVAWDGEERVGIATLDALREGTASVGGLSGRDGGGSRSGCTRAGRHDHERQPVRAPPLPARRLKPSIPQVGNDGIPIHELDLVRPLEPSDRSPHDEQRHIAVLWVAERFRDPPHDLNPSDVHIATADALVSATALK